MEEKRRCGRDKGVKEAKSVKREVEKSVEKRRCEGVIGVEREVERGVR